MAQQTITTVENNFTGGLKTEYTGLNFPENSATDTDNCIYSLTGEVSRRLGFDYEDNNGFYSLNRDNKAISYYKWNNVNGDGVTQIYVVQIGSDLIYYLASAATNASPISQHIMQTSTTISGFRAQGSSANVALKECQYSDGNGYLFVTHPDCDPFYVVYNPLTGKMEPSRINIQIRDFTGVNDNLNVNDRPLTLEDEHLYNLINQGWTQGSPWTATSNTSQEVKTETKHFAVAPGLSIDLGDQVVIRNALTINLGDDAGDIPAGSPMMMGSVSGYDGTDLTVNVTRVGLYSVSIVYANWIITAINKGYLSTWNTAAGNYPSDADIWWRFKNDSGVFDPTTTYGNVTLGSGPAPKGHFILDAFSQQRSVISAVPGLTNITTSARPSTLTWFQGRVWYTGINASFPVTNDAKSYTWTENIYFSQVVTDTTQFGNCYQVNDPTSQDLFDLLPTDGGVIQIQGCGVINKLFPIQNGLLVFCSNGIWFVTGSQGIGFSANDYTITKISSVQSISATSFVDVLGYPIFWNEEDIYTVSAAQQGLGLVVTPLCFDTILSFYADIPTSCKRYAKGAYDPINYTITWVYRATDDQDSINLKNQYDRMLSFNTKNKSFYPYSLPDTITKIPRIHGITYMTNSGLPNSPEPTFKYFTSIASGNSYNLTFSEEIMKTTQIGRL